MPYLFDCIVVVTLLGCFALGVFRGWAKEAWGLLFVVAGVLATAACQQAGLTFTSQRQLADATAAPETAPKRTTTPFAPGPIAGVAGSAIQFVAASFLARFLGRAV